MQRRFSAGEAILPLIAFLTSAMSARTPTTSYPRRPGDAAVAEAYANLPMRFEANLGQAGQTARFLARNGALRVSLSPTGAGIEVPGGGLKLSLLGASPSLEIQGLDEMSGKVNYFIGNDPRRWLTGVPTFSRVWYHGVYPGIDLVFYGTGKQLEYDFVVAPGADPSLIELTLDGAGALSLDGMGDLRVALSERAVRMRKPVIYQLTTTGRRLVAGGYLLRSHRTVSFKVGGYDPSQPLVIDPVVDYASYLGGSGYESISAVAVDAAGNVYITGNASTGFPLSKPPQGELPWYGMFVAKLNPAGSELVYSTFLGGSNGGGEASGIAVDASGNAYVAGTTWATDFPTTPNAAQKNNAGGGDPFLPFVADAFATKLNASGSGLVYSTYVGGAGNDRGTSIAVDSSGSAMVAGSNDPNPGGAYVASDRVSAFVAKLNPAGSAFVYRTTIGGSMNDWANGIASGPQGNAYVTGATFSPDFPVASALQPLAASAVAYRSSDGGKSWERCDKGLSANTSILLVDPVNPSTVYAAGDRGIYRSLDGGDSWSPAKSGLSNPWIGSLVVDPRRSGTLYAIGMAGGMLDPPAVLFKSTSGGANWITLSLNVEGPSPRAWALAIDPSNSETLYAAVNETILKSTDAGGHWTPTGFKGQVLRIAVEPGNSATIYALYADTSSAEYVMRLARSDDGGNNWNTLEAAPPGRGNGPILIDPRDNQVVYLDALNGIAMSADRGRSWKMVHPSARLLDIGRSGNRLVLHAATPESILTSSDSGASWAPAGRVPAPLSLAVDPTQPERLYAGTATGLDAFVTMLDAGGHVVSSTFLGGTGSDEGHAIAADSQGNVYFTGSTSSADFPGVPAGRSFQADPSDGFVAKMRPAESLLIYARYVGGGGADDGRAIAVDSSGIVYVAGLTGSADFPVSLQSSRAGRALVMSADGGSAWAAAQQGLPTSDVRVLATSRQSAVIYAGGVGGVFVSRDGGQDWEPTGLRKASINVLAVDPQSPSTLYAAAGGSSGVYRNPEFAPSGIFQSTDDGATWRSINEGLSSLDVRALVIDSHTPSTLYAATADGVFKSVDSGGRWTIAGHSIANVRALAIDPDKPSTVYALSPGWSSTDILKSEDAGANWRPVLQVPYFYEDFEGSNTISVDPRNPATIQALVWGELYTSNDAGEKWRTLPLPADQPCAAYAHAQDPTESSTIYVGGIGMDQSCLFRSVNGGQSWTRIYDKGIGVFAIALNPLEAGKVYAAVDPGTDAFLVKLSPDASSMLYSTYLGGSRTDAATGVTVDSAGNVWVVGNTSSDDFPVVRPLQPSFGGKAEWYRAIDIFLVRVAEK